MPEKWTGDLVGKMHLTRTTIQDLADELHVTKGYISQILNGLKSPKGAKERLFAAYNAVQDRRKEAGR